MMGDASLMEGMDILTIVINRLGLLYILVALIAGAPRYVLANSDS